METFNGSLMGINGEKVLKETKNGNQKPPSGNHPR